jgi:hypothetical protein
MKRILRSWWLWSFFFFTFTLGLAIPWVHEIRAETKPSLAVLPFIIHRADDLGRGVACPICKGIIQRGEITLGSQNTLTRLLHQKMEDMGTFKVLPRQEVEKAFSQIDRRQFELKPVHSSIQLGKTLNMDFILVGVLFRFEERVGSAIGAAKPASVGFDVHLFRIRDGKMVWVGKFDETQKPLSENLLKIGSFVRRKASWLTATELASVGTDEMLRRLPGPKELEE